MSVDRKPLRRTPRRWTFAELPHPGDTIDFGDGEVGTVLLLSTEQTEDGTAAEFDNVGEFDPIAINPLVRHRYMVAVVETARVLPVDGLSPPPPGMTITTDRVDEMGFPLTVEEVLLAEAPEELADLAVLPDLITLEEAIDDDLIELTDLEDLMKLDGLKELEELTENREELTEKADED